MDGNVSARFATQDTFICIVQGRTLMNNDREALLASLFEFLSRSGELSEKVRNPAISHTNGDLPAMTDFNIVVDIKARPDRVLEVLCDVERWPEWTASTTSVRRMDEGPLAVGSKARVRQPKLLPAIWQVTEFSETGFTWVTRSIGLQIEAGHSVQAVGTGSNVALSLRFSGLLAPVVAWVYRDLNQRYLSMEAEGLRKRSEG